MLWVYQILLRLFFEKFCFSKKRALLAKCMHLVEQSETLCKVEIITIKWGQLFNTYYSSTKMYCCGRYCSLPCLPPGIALGLALFLIFFSVIPIVFISLGYVQPEQYNYYWNQKSLQTQGIGINISFIYNTSTYQCNSNCVGTACLRCNCSDAYLVINYTINNNEYSYFQPQITCTGNINATNEKLQPLVGKKYDVHYNPANVVDINIGPKPTNYINMVIVCVVVVGFFVFTIIGLFVHALTGFGKY